MVHLNQKQARKKLYFDCRNGVLRYPDPGFSDAVNELTIAVLMRYPNGSTPAANDRIVFINSSANGVNAALSLGGVNQNIIFRVDAGNSSATLQLTTANDENLTDDTWHTVVGTFDVAGFGADPVTVPSQAAVYIDGVASGEDAEMDSGSDPLDSDELDLSGGTISVSAADNNGSRCEADYAVIVVAEGRLEAAQAVNMHKALLQKDPAAISRIFGGEEPLFLAFPTLQPGASLDGIDPEVSPICGNLGWARLSNGVDLPTSVADGGGSGAKPVVREYLGPIA